MSRFLSCDDDLLRTQAAAQGAQVILLQELFEAPYFCQLQRQDFFNLASPADVR
jgi:N-carbamoylputrescine amidase